MCSSPHTNSDAAVDKEFGVGKMNESIFLCSGPWKPRRKHATAIWNDSIYLFGGFDGQDAGNLNDVWKYDSGTWHLINNKSKWSGRDGHCAIIFEKKCLILGGTDDPYFCRNDVWMSEDGQTWTKLQSSALWSPRWQHAAVVHDQMVYVMGGWGDEYLNDVWRSSDGIDWELLCPVAPWRGRMFHSVVSFQNNLYLIGGCYGKTFLNDIWKSSDGVHWTLLLNEAPWRGRQGQSVAVLGDFIFLCGGYDGNTQLNDIWYTCDCVSWYQLKIIPSFAPRQGHSLITYQDSLFVIGGFSDGVCLNDTHQIRLSTDLPHVHLHEQIPQRSRSLSLQNRGSNSNLVALETSLSTNHLLLTIKEFILHRVEINLIQQEFIYIVGIIMSSLNISSNFELNEERFSDILPRESSESIISLNRPSELTQGVEFENVTLRSLLFGSEESSVLNKIISMTNTNQQDDLLLQHNISKNYSSPTRLSLEDLLFDHNSLHPILSSNEESQISTAALSDLFRKYQHLIQQVQTNIFLLAENPSSNEADLRQYLNTRVNLAKEAYEPTFKLKSYLDNSHSSFNNWLLHLSRVLQYLENTIRYFNELTCHDNSRANLSSLESCSWKEWKDSVNNLYHTLWSSNTSSYSSSSTSSSTSSSSTTSSSNSLFSSEVSLFIQQLRTTQGTEDIVNILMKSLELIEKQSLEQVLDYTLNEKFQIRKIEYCKLIENIFTFLKTTSTSPALPLDDIHFDLQLRQRVISSIQAEMFALSVSQSQFYQHMTDICIKGHGFLTLFYNKMKSYEINLSELQAEVTHWIQLLERMSSNYPSLEDQCNKLCEENEANEKKLIELECLRIDAKSELEKMSFKLTRMKRTRSSTPTVDSITQIESSLLQKVVEAEQNVEKFRKNMRLWYRNVRALASTISPELYFYLPDLLWSGSLLGDGGFAQHGKLPKRPLVEYKEILPLLSGLSSTSRHILLKAKHQEKDVVLKGFDMTQASQRSCLEREIRVLGNLRSEFIIAPSAIIDDLNEQKSSELWSQYSTVIFLEFPFFASGNLKNWRLASNRSPWELQSVVRQLLYGLMYLHDHQIIHADVRPSNILMHSDGRAVISDFELAFNLNDTSENYESSRLTKEDGHVYVSPEIQMGKRASLASDMFSAGVILYFLHFPENMSRLIPGELTLPSSCDPDLADLIQKLLRIDPLERPTAANSLNHPYIRSTFVDQMMLDGELVDQNKKIHAVRDLFKRIRRENRNNLLKITINRNSIVSDMLNTFQEIPISRMKSLLRINFEGESGVDEGGMLVELFTLFFDRILSGDGGYFHGPTSAMTPASTSTSATAPTAPATEVVSVAGVATTTTTTITTRPTPVRNSNQLKNNFSNHQYVMPCDRYSPNNKRLLHYEIFGRLLMKCLDCNCRIGNQLCPVVFKFITNPKPSLNIRDLQFYDPELAKSFQWILATSQVQDIGLNFDSINLNNGPVTDENKHLFIQQSIERHLILNQQEELLAIRKGFIDCLEALSEEAAPFVTLLSHTDWRILLCGDLCISPSKVNNLFQFTGFNRKSKIPMWLKEIILDFDEIMIRKFLVFVTGSPSLPFIEEKSLGVPSLSSSSPSPSSPSISSISSGSAPSGSSSSAPFHINVRGQYRSTALPVAHTCFFHLDIPDYKEKEMLLTKLLYAIDHATTFEIV